MHQYKLICKKGEGTFSEVLKAQSLKTGNYVAIKCMKNHFTSIEQVQRLREIQALKKVSPHQHVIKLIEVLFDEPTGRLALVFELMDMNLYECIRGRKTYLNLQKVKYYIYQLLKAIDHMHRKGIFHRDIKPENILLLGDLVKLADFGSCKGMFSEQPYTEYISTRWYRAPECLLTDGYYDYKMDLWGVGCVLFEVVSLFPLFPGTNELDQVHKIHNILGTPHAKVLERFKAHATHMEFNFPPKKGTGIEKLIPHIEKNCLDLIQKLLIYDPEERITAEDALRHPWFRDLYELDQTNNNNNFHNSTLTTIKLSPSSHKYNRTLPEQAEAIIGSTQKLEQISQKLALGQQSYYNNSNSNNNNNFNQTQKYNPYRDTTGENVFYPVLSIKKANKQKKKFVNNANKNGSLNPNIMMGYQTFKLDLKIEGGYKDSGTEEENNNNDGKIYFPPIQKNLPVMHMETKVNLYGGMNSTKQKEQHQNPFKQTLPYQTMKKKKNQNEQLILMNQQQHHHSNLNGVNAGAGGGGGGNSNSSNQNEYMVLGKKASYI